MWREEARAYWNWPPKQVKMKMVHSHRIIPKLLKAVEVSLWGVPDRSVSSYHCRVPHYNILKSVASYPEYCQHLDLISIVRCMLHHQGNYLWKEYFFLNRFWKFSCLAIKFCHYCFWSFDSEDCSLTVLYSVLKLHLWRAAWVMRPWVWFKDACVETQRRKVS